jgi:Pentapeptide repeats (8 copies)
MLENLDLPRWAIVIAVIVTAGVVLTGLWWCWWILPKKQAERLQPKIPKAKSLAHIEDAYRKTIGQLIAGGAVLFGAWLTFFSAHQQLLIQQKVSADQIKATYDNILSQQKEAENQLKASRDQLLSQQVSKGFEQLGSDKLPIRLGGIYALEGVMNNSEDFHKPLLDALCAFVREGAKSQTSTTKSTKVDSKNRSTDVITSELPQLDTDIQAAITVIARRKYKKDTPNLVGVNISMAQLHWADLIGAELQGADLRGANLHMADLQWANLRGAKLLRADLSRAGLNGADLSETDVSQPQLNDACGNEKTKLPPGLTIKECAPIASK